MPLKAQKVSNADVDGYISTIQWDLLNCTNVDGNNNKFFIIELQENSNEGKYRIFTNYGRVGDRGVFDIRGPIDDLSVAEKEYESIIKSKLRGKTIKDSDGNSRKECYVKVEVIAPTVGSINIRKISGNSVTASVNRQFGDVFDKLDFDPQCTKILKQFLEENVHNITSKTSLTLTANGLETPLGPVTIDHVQKARDILKELQELIEDDNKTDNIIKSIRGGNTEYYSLIPHTFGRKITDNDLISDTTKLITEFELLDDLEAAVQISDVEEEKHIDIGFEISLANKIETKRIIDKYMTTRNHHGLGNWKVVNVYKFRNTKVRDRYNRFSVTINGPIEELFHGSKNSNNLSIMMNGFIIPPVNAPHVTGRMFGNGVYAASASTKALNYATGYWSHSSNKYSNVFMFITKFAMGKVYETQYSQPDGPPKGYNSIWAKSGRSLINDEYIVYNLGQTDITYLIELEN